MKKYFSALCIAAVGLAMAACTPKEEIKPGGETVAPELGEIQGCVLDNAGPDIVVDYKAADFGTSAIINYALFVDQAGKDMATKQQVKAKAEGGKLTISQVNLNNAIIALGAAVNTEVAVELQLVAYLGSTIGTASLESNIVSANFTTCLAQTIDYDTYDYVYTIGAFNDWKFEEAPGDGVQQYLYDYEGNGVYEGLLYFSGLAHSGWKISGVAAWDDSCNWGFNDSGDDQYLVGTDPVEAFTLQCSGGSKDMKAWSRNFAYFTFNKAELGLQLKSVTSWGDASFGVQFDYVLVTGDFCKWAETVEGGAVKMNYDPVLHRFYADITVDAEGGIKLIAPNSLYDSPWRLQWGQEGLRTTTAEISNVSVAPGNQRVYLDVNHDEITISADKFGAAEEHGVLAENIPEPVVLAPEPSVWTVLGSFNNWPVGEEGDNCIMTELAHHEWVYYGLELKAGDELKVRGDHSWDSESYGAADGKNVIIAEDGTYDIYFKYEDRYVNALLCGGGYSVIGKVGGYNWTMDFEMTEGEPGIYVSAPLKIEGAFKIRYRHAWDGAIGAAETNATDGVDQVYELTVGEPAPAVADGKYNFHVAPGTYTVTYDSTNGTVSVDNAFPSTVYFIGQYNNWDWNTCTELVPVNGVAGQFWTVRYLEAGSEFKFNTAKAWNGDETASVGEAIGFTTPGNGVVENAGLYMIFVDYTQSKTTVAPASIYGMGGCFAGGWDAGTPFTVNEDGTASISTTAEAELRMYAAAPEGYSIDWWRMEFIFFEDGVIAYRGNGGDQDRYTVAAGKTITLDFNAGTGSVE